MPPKSPFDNVALPHLHTRKALLVLDLQNDFVSADGALPATSPDGFVDRAIEVAKAFRESVAGDVIWIRSVFEDHRPAGNEQIVTRDKLSSPRSAAPARGRRRPSEPADEPSDGDPEAFLSTGPSPEQSGSGSVHRECVRPDTPGSELAAQVAAAVDTGRDLVLTKSHYSAFESNQLLMRLRTRFITELYICGALTNISIYATALDAGRHGLAINLIDDCCGYRSLVRHTNAVRKLAELTGCETLSAQAIIAELSPERNKKGGRSSGGTSRGTSRGAVGRGARGGDDKSLPLRPKSPSPPEAAQSHKKSTPSTAAPIQPQPKTAQTSQPTVAPDSSVGPLEADSDESPPAETVPASSRSRISKSAAELNKKSMDIADASALRVARLMAQRAKREAAAESASHQQLPPTIPPQAEKASSESTAAIEESQDPESSIAASSKPPADKESLSKESSSQPSVEMASAKPAPATEPICEGDTAVFHNVLPPAIEEGIFERLRDEVHWLRMSHQGGEVPRLICVQGEVDNEGNMPAYRHPADESPPLVPFSPTMVQIKDEVEKILGHPLNHVLIQFYRTGNDYISEHSDKTLDIVRGSFICNVSLGAERTMIFRTKRVDKDPSRTDSPSPPPEDLKRQTIRIQLPHNSLCRMGLKTNMRWLHAIRQDKRADRDKLPTELAFDGGRISLTFRQIGTFLDSNSTVIWGQGATCKTRDGARAVVNGQTPEAVKMLQAFGTENHSSDFDWEKHYGSGFDILHMSNAPRFFSSSDPVVNMRIQLMLAEYDIAYAKGSMGPAPRGKDGKVSSDAKPSEPESTPLVKFVDNDPDKSVVQGDAAILLYLDAVYGSGGEGETLRPGLGRKFTRFQQALELAERWRAVLRTAIDQAPSEDGGSKPSSLPKSLKRELAIWDGYASEAHGGGGTGKASLADFAVWPVLHDMAQACGGEDDLLSSLKALGYEALGTYYSSFKKRSCVGHVLKAAHEA